MSKTDAQQYIQNIGASGPGTTGPYPGYVGGAYAVDGSGNVGSDNQAVQDLINGLASTIKTYSPATSDSAARQTVEAFFRGYTASNSNATNLTNAGITSRPLPSSFTDFVKDLLTFAGLSPSAITDITQTVAYKTFLAVFKTYSQSSGSMYALQSTPASLTNYTLPAVITDNNADWSVLPSTVSDGSGGTGSVEDVQFQKAFAAFLKNFPSSSLENVHIDSNGVSVYNFVTSSSFLGSWSNFISATSILQDETKNNTLEFTGVGGGSFVFGTSADANQSLLNYESIYKAFFPNASDAEFQAYVQKFYNKVTSDPSGDGYFNPSHFVDEFFSSVKAQYLLPMGGHGVNFDFTKPRLGIIWEVLAHIRDMVSVIQNISVFVSKRLNYLTSYQKAYTDLIATIPTFKSGTPFNADDTVSVNNTLNNYRTNLSSYRDQVTADSKKIQSFIDSLSQGSTNALNQGSALLTMMNGLLSIIHA